MAHLRRLHRFAVATEAHGPLTDLRAAVQQKAA